MKCWCRASRWQWSNMTLWEWICKGKNHLGLEQLSLYFDGPHSKSQSQELTCCHCQRLLIRLFERKGVDRKMKNWRREGKGGHWWVIMIRYTRCITIGWLHGVCLVITERSNNVPWAAGIPCLAVGQGFRWVDVLSLCTWEWKKINAILRTLRYWGGKALTIPHCDNAFIIP